MDKGLCLPNRYLQHVKPVAANPLAACTGAMENAPASAAPALAGDGHWSGVRPGEEFTLSLQFDASCQEQNVEAKLRRHEVDGFSESITPGWSWSARKDTAVKSKAADSRYHAEKS